MKIDNGHFFNVEPVIDLEHFVELLLVTLADGDVSQIISKDTKTKKYARVYSDFKEKIEKAMYSEHALEYLQLIDSYQYYEKQADWEEELVNCLNKYVSKRKHNYDFKDNCVQIEFTREEIEKILSNYDEKTQNIMNDLIWRSDMEYCYINVRHNKLIEKKYVRDIHREYIKTGKHTFSNKWNNTEKKENKKVKILVNPDYIRKKYF